MVEGMGSKRRRAPRLIFEIGSTDETRDGGNQRVHIGVDVFVPYRQRLDPVGRKELIPTPVRGIKPSQLFLDKRP